MLHHLHHLLIQVTNCADLGDWKTRNNPDQPEQHYFCESCHVRYFGSSSYSNLCVLITFLDYLE